MDYKIVSEHQAEALQREVQAWIDKGWQPIGGVAVCVTGDGRGGDYWLHQQAMTSTRESREAAAFERDYCIALERRVIELRQERQGA